jgi:phage terminase large subunit-like protein
MTAAVALDYEGRTHPEYLAPVVHLPYIANMLGPADLRNPAASAAELKQRLAALRMVHIRRAREHFPSFMQFCFSDPSSGKPFAQQWFHDEWSEAWDNDTRVLIIAPRNHGKTSQIVGRVIWELGRNPNLRIKIVCAADGRAKERLFEIVQHLEQNPRIRDVFPHLQKDPNAEWSKHKIVVVRDAKHRDASVEALGITATATGGRCDLLIADDVVDRRNALSMPALRVQIKQAWKSDWTNLLEPDSSIWYICTLWHKDDLSHELMENPAFRTMFYAIPHDFGSMWPVKWPEADLRARHAEIGSVEFNRGYRNQAVDEDTGAVQSGWFKFRDLSQDQTFLDRASSMFVLTSYDTAVATHMDADFSAECAIAVDPDAGNIYVLNAWHAHLTIAKQAQQVRREYLHYSPYRVLIEKVGQAVLDEWVLNDYPDMKNAVEVTRPKVSKYQRLLAVTPLMEQGRVIFDESLNPDSDKWDPAKGSLVHELLDFPFGKHDDMVDAFSQALAGARRYFLDDWAPGPENEETEGADGARYLY